MVLIFVASLNENMKLAKVLHEQLKVESEIINLVELYLPMYDSIKEENDGIPLEIESIMNKMKDAQGYIIVTPEYNFSTPPVLTNFIAWVSRSGDDFREVFTLKKIQLATHSGGGGQDVLNTLRSQLTRLGSLVVPREVITTYQSPLKKESSMRILNQFESLLKE